MEQISNIEKRLWGSADTLRANSNFASNEYFMPVMGLIFLRHAYSRFLKVRDEEGFRRAAARTAALGFDGKWVLHPAQVDAGNEVFSPRQEEFDKAEGILAAYAHSTSVEGGARGAVMFGDEMLDEASRKMALVVSARGRAAGMTVSSQGSADA